MKKKQKEEKEIDILEDEESEKNEDKKVKGKRRESVEKRKKAKEMDRAARWSGFILLVIIMFVGFLLWISGEMKAESMRGNTVIVK